MVKMNEQNLDSSKHVHIHLISDATGESSSTLLRAGLAQFPGVEPIEHNWPLVRTKGQMDRVLQGISRNPGLVIYTLVTHSLREYLEDECQKMNVETIAVMDPVIRALARQFKREGSGETGGQYCLDHDYFKRIEAMEFSLAHDDGQSLDTIYQADVVLIGVSRSSKTPTCIYLANRGLKAANIPIVPNVPMPAQLFTVTKPMVIGLTKNPQSLVEIRRNREREMGVYQATDYVDLDLVRGEVQMARRLCEKYSWPVIDVSRRSIEETATKIMTIYKQEKEND